MDRRKSPTVHQPASRKTSATGAEERVPPGTVSAGVARQKKVLGATRQSSTTVALWLSCIFPMVVLAVMGWRQRWMSDDGMINIRVVDQFVAGNGLVYNMGERVEVGTSTLWLGLLLLSTVVAPGSETSVIAVGLGWVLTLVGFAAGTAASVMSQRSSGRILLPAGMLIVAFLPPMWDFTTSGLETGLTFAWIGMCSLALVWRLQSRPGQHAWAPVWLPVLIGLGPLIRPDLVLMSMCFGVALLLQSRRSILGSIGAIITAGVLPLGWQLFRMGYFAAVVPNTALAKSAAGSRWDQGLTYLWDVVGRYGLLIAFGIVLLLAIGRGSRSGLKGNLGRAAVVLAPTAAGLAHSAFVIRVGGDFMHGRLLLPGLFAIAMAQAVVPLRKHSRLMLAGVVVIAVSSVFAGLFIRFPHFAKWDLVTGIADERRFYTDRNGGAVTLSRYDWRGSNYYKIGNRLNQDAARGLRRYEDGSLILDPAEGYGVVYTTSNLGIIGVVAGNDVFVADRHALADAVASRMDVDESTTRIGHTPRPAVWRQARYAAPQPNDAVDVRDARAALRCGELGALNQAITAPMSSQQFIRNIQTAVGFTRLTIPANPQEAREKFCGPV